METPFPIKKRFDYPTLTATTFASGGRVYNTPHCHEVPSVTTILSATVPKDGLVAWRQRIGDEEADRIVDEACDIGTTMHDRLEGYVSNYLQGRANIPPDTENEKVAYTMAENMKRFGLIDLDEVWGIEEALYCENLYAGRTDLIGVYNGKSAVIDYKSARRWKKPEWVESYRLQIAAYNFCHKAMFGEGLETGVILICIRPSNNPYSKQQSLQKFVLNHDELQHYEEKWLACVDKYYSERG